MKLNKHCSECLYNREKKRALEIENSDERKAYLQEVEEIVTHGDFQSQVEFLDAVFRLYDGKYGKTESYHELKEKFNSFMLQQEEAIMPKN